MSEDDSTRTRAAAILTSEIRRIQNMANNHDRDSNTGIGLSPKDRIIDIENELEKHESGIAGLKEHFSMKLNEHEAHDVARFNETNLKIAKLIWQMTAIGIVAGFVGNWLLKKYG